MQVFEEQISRLCMQGILWKLKGEYWTNTYNEDDNRTKRRKYGN